MTLDNPFFLSGLALVGVGLVRAVLLYVQVLRGREQDGSDSE
ncbi:hypothetical protein ACOT81_37805 [Streptomyces sp. WI04-05B]|nr:MULTISPECIES: hypothetical protein [unclassified Streptomyces]MDX2545824.1 hypothetical protein [Streptomyces sp. WI04-05B]MDX2586383.1 hypothetical protein [Streptomyces sp. WI04-05A]MDX3749033.1 hypothetical protein [Streptomyces sp. AK08-02]